MIAFKDIYDRTRLLADDMQKAKYSDYELYAAVNAAIDMLCGGLRKYFSPELIRRADLTPVSGSCALPEGFLYMSDVVCDGDWRVESDSFLSDKSAKIAYAKHPGRVAQMTDTIDLAESFLIYIASVSASLLKGDESAALEKVYSAASEMSADKRGILPDPGMWQ